MNERTTEELYSNVDFTWIVRGGIIIGVPIGSDVDWEILYDASEMLMLRHATLRFQAVPRIRVPSALSRNFSAELNLLNDLTIRGLVADITRYSSIRDPWHNWLT